MILVVLVVFIKFASGSDLIRAIGDIDRISIVGCNKSGFSPQILSSLHEGSNWILNPRSLASKYNHRHLFFAPLGCDNVMPILIEADRKNFFSLPFKWLIFSKENFETSLVNLSILVNSDFNVAQPLNNGSTIVTKIYKKHLNSQKFETEYFGIYHNDADEFFKNYLYKNVICSRKHLNITLNSCLVITNNDSLNHLTDKRDKHIDSTAKVNYVLANIMASIYDINWNFSITSTWGYKDNNSQWSGMMGELVRKEADIGGTSLFMLRERIDLIEYIAMISPTRSKFVFRQPKLSYVSNVYTLPFDRRVWWSTIAIIVIMVIILYLLVKWEHKRNEWIQGNNVEIIDNSLYEILFVTFGAVCQQSAAVLPRSLPGRVATLCLFLSLMFIYVSYSANIVALLQTSSTNIRTLEDLLKSRIPVGVDDTVFNHFFFTTANEPIRKAIYEKKVAPPGKRPNFFPIEEGVKRMRHGLFAFHMETGSGYKIVGETFQEHEKCGLQEIQYLQVVDPWLAIQKNSTYKELLKIGLKLLHEHGIQQRENNLIYTKRPACTSKSTIAFVSVGLVDCYPVLVIWGVGIMAAFLISLVELFMHYEIAKFR